MFFCLFILVLVYTISHVWIAHYTAQTLVVWICVCACVWLYWYELLYISHIIYTRFLNVNCSLEYLLDSFVVVFFFFVQIILVNTHWYDPCVLRQVPPCRHGFDWHSSTSSEQVLPSNPFGQWHLKLPPGNDVHVPPFWHGDDEQRFCFSHSFPKIR